MAQSPLAAWRWDPLMGRWWEASGWWRWWPSSCQKGKAHRRQSWCGRPLKVGQWESWLLLEKVWRYGLGAGRGSGFILRINLQEGLDLGSMGSLREKFNSHGKTYGIRTITLRKGRERRCVVTYHRGRPASLTGGADRPHLLARHGLLSRTFVKLDSISYLHQFCYERLKDAGGSN